jgi:hypothetical protein
MILFVLMAVAILFIAFAGIYLVFRLSEDGPTFSDLDKPGFLDRAYIALASRNSWNDTD